MSWRNRLFPGRKPASWFWVDDQYAAYFPDQRVDRVMAVESRDRYHAKQGRSTSRLVLHAGDSGVHGPLSVYLKRHFQLTRRERLAAWLRPSAARTPARVERDNLERVRALGIQAPAVVAEGARFGPGGAEGSFLMVRELVGQEAVNELLPKLARSLEPLAFQQIKRSLAREIARISAALHRAGVFHSDLYLCHFFVDPRLLNQPATTLSLIDLHRMVEPRLAKNWRRLKDLAQLLYSTDEVAELTDRDRLRFLVHYARFGAIRRPRWLARLVWLRAARYRAHNRRAGV